MSIMGLFFKKSKKSKSDQMFDDLIIECKQIHEQIVIEETQNEHNPDLEAKNSQLNMNIQNALSMANNNPQKISQILEICPTSFPVRLQIMQELNQSILNSIEIGDAETIDGCKKLFLFCLDDTDGEEALVKQYETLMVTQLNKAKTNKKQRKMAESLLDCMEEKEDLISRIKSSNKRLAFETKLKEA